LLNASFKYKLTDVKSVWRLKVFIATGGSSGGGATVGGFQVPGQGAAGGGGGSASKNLFQEFDLAKEVTYTRGTEFYAVLHFGKQGGDLWCRVEHSGDSAKKLILDKPVPVGLGPDGRTYFVRLSVTFGDTVVGLPEKIRKPDPVTEIGPDGLAKPQPAGSLSLNLAAAAHAAETPYDKAPDSPVVTTARRAAKKAGKKKTQLKLKELVDTDSDDAPPPPPDD